MHKRWAMRKARVLLTGFEPFDGASFNISEKVVSEIKKSGFNEVDLETKILTVDERGSRCVSELIMEKEFDCVLQLGFSNKARKINLESKAVNKINMKIKDNSEREISNKMVISRGKSELMTTFEELNNLDKTFPEVMFSSDAGTFVCNETYFRTLHSIFENNICDRFGRPLPCIFIHLPSNKYVSLPKQINFISWLINKINNKKIIEVVAAIIHNKEGKILVAKRDNKQPHPGKWEFPGGKLESLELEEDGLKREIFEELNLNIEILSNCGEITHLYDEYFVKLKAMNAKIDKNSEHMKLNVHEEILWLSSDDLTTLDWLDANKKLVKIIQNHS